jgi:hypothetical protein
MMSFALGYAGTITLAIVVLRGIWTGLWKTYPLFYAQIACSLTATLLGIWIWWRHPAAYGWWYWDAQFATMVAACANLVEVIQHGLAKCNGAERFAGAIRYALCAAVIGFSFAYVRHLKEWRRVLPFVSLERDFRAVQALLLVALVGGIFYFGVPLGRNVKGILVGYGIYVGASLVTLAVESRFPAPFLGVWNQMQPLAYNLTLVVYLISLWRYSPAPSPEPASRVVGARQESFVS